MKYKIFAGILLCEILLLTTLAVSAAISSTKRAPALEANQQLVENLMLTDLSLWTETSYSRHPSQADFFAPFQDAPGAIERFPAGSLTAPAALYNISQRAASRPNSPGRIAETDSDNEQAARK
ncbi:MAG: hypothetical protein RI601_00290 [Desulfurivibrionaceae bacterium]|nr:hypothetical protein [Desulfurivibrionaceae bacterium]